ncbi:DUF167 domain-containing protein [Luethyella okanaganae]|uniref:DUF167 domain-containing protein n=1 Tax=Luethyella okanaganae TaxID=69372 RepID=A0ABW1VH85_9MICO
MQLVTVRVKPGSSKGPLVETDTVTDASGGALPAPPALVVYLSERAVDGQANSALVAVLAKHFHVARRQVEIVRGHTARVKHVRIDD